MISPGDEFLSSGDPAPFVARWNTLIAALIAEPSIKLVARTAVDYGLYDGEGIYPGDPRLARQTSYDRKTVGHAFKVLRGLDMAIRVTESGWSGKRLRADEYDFVIPTTWRALPLLGPRFGRFTCQQCGKVFDPQPGTVIQENGTIGWHLSRMVFCSAKPLRSGKPSCLELWNENRQRHRLLSWGATEDKDCWEMFNQARSDDWPPGRDVPG